MNRPRPTAHALLQSLLGFVGLATTTGAAYLVLSALDGEAGVALARLAAVGAAEAMVGYGEVTVAVLGIAITVVAIIVELAANRYTPRITELFVHDRVNQLVLGFFAFTSALVLLAGTALSGNAHGGWLVAGPFAAMLVSLWLVLPYFLYVFDFLSPTSIIAHIEGRARGSIRRVRTGRLDVRTGQAEVRSAVEQLGDIATNAIDKNDSAIAIAALERLRDIVLTALDARDAMPEGWFDVVELARHDPDLVALHPNIVRAIRDRHTWVEMKVLRQYQGLFAASLGRMKDVDHLITIHTRTVAERTAAHGNAPGLDLALRFMNTYLRSALNARNVRTAYNLLNEYRQLAETLMAQGHHDRVTTIAERFKFYGQLAFHRQLTFLLETAAYDLCTLLEVAHATGSPVHDALLDIFLDVDREPDHEAQESALRGVRKAQVKLATWYLVQGEEPLARRIWADMADEAPVRLRSIREELEGIVDPEYWEVSDRGINFDWLPDDRRARIGEFFGWFEAS